MLWDRVGWGGVESTPTSPSQHVAVHGEEDRAERDKWRRVAVSGNCQWKGKRRQAERGDVGQRYHLTCITLHLCGCHLTPHKAGVWAVGHGKAEGNAAPGLLPQPAAASLA